MPDSELQILRRLSYKLYELIMGHEDILTKHLGVGIQFAEAQNSINRLIDSLEEN